MRQSQIFSKTLREDPKDEISINARYLERGGFVHKVMAGVYAYLPLGFRVLERVNKIIREEMNAAGGEELMMSALQPKDIWSKTGRWQELSDVMYQFEDSSKKPLGLAITHEEPLADIARHFISSYRDLPRYVYQIQLKFRNEPRAKSGLLRSREFLMKDLYSFDRDEAGLNRSYEIFKNAYRKIFSRCGLDARVVEASGGAFTKEFTHEFQVIADAGEDEIVYCESCDFAQNNEIATVRPPEKCLYCGGKLALGKSIEVGHIYKLGTKYSKALDLFYTDESGEKKLVVMGSYGIGPGRVIGAVVETHHDEKGIIWPASIAPFQVHLLELGTLRSESEKIYRALEEKHIETLWDDREDKTAGEKFADADLIGIPLRAVVSEKSLAKGGIEIKERASTESRIMKPEAFLRVAEELGLGYHPN